MQIHRSTQQNHLAGDGCLHSCHPVHLNNKTKNENTFGVFGVVLLFVFVYLFDRWLCRSRNRAHLLRCSSLDSMLQQQTYTFHLFRYFFFLSLSLAPLNSIRFFPLFSFPSNFIFLFPFRLLAIAHSFCWISQTIFFILFVFLFESNNILSKLISCNRGCCTALI